MCWQDAAEHDAAFMIWAMCGGGLVGSRNSWPSAHSIAQRGKPYNKLRNVAKTYSAGAQAHDKASCRSAEPHGNTWQNMA
jgi:hypothetical protein